MARYKALRKGYPNKQVETDEEFDWDGVPGSWMEPLDDEAKAAFAARFGADAKPKGGVEDRRPMGAAPVGGKTQAVEIETLKAHVKTLEALVLQMQKGGPSTPAPSSVDDLDKPPGGSEAIDPAVTAALDKRRARQASKEAV